MFDVENGVFDEAQTSTVGGSEVQLATVAVTVAAEHVDGVAALQGQKLTPLYRISWPFPSAEVYSETHECVLTCLI